MGYAEKIVDRPMKVHDGNQFMDEFRGLRSDDMPTENLTRLRMTEHFHMSIRFAQAERLSMIVKRVGGHKVGEMTMEAFPFGQPDAGYLRISKDDLRVEAVIIVLGWLIWMHCVPSGDFALFDRNMDDFIPAVDISNSKNMRLGCSHFLVD